MSNYKYPYIPKPYYPAVMLACRIIREEQAFNKAINSAAKYYNVDKEELEHHVRSRQGAGQRKSTKTRRYKYYVCCECVVCEGPNTYHNPSVRKASSPGNAANQIPMRSGGGDGAYGWESFGVCITEHNTKEEAEANMIADFMAYRHSKR